MLTQEINKADYVESVTSITNIPLVTSSQKPLTELINEVPNILSEDINKKLAREEILSSPIYKDLIISSDAKTSAMQIVIRKNQNLLDALNKRDMLYQKYVSNPIYEDDYIESKATYDSIVKEEKENIGALIKQLRVIQDKYSSQRYEIRLGGIPMITDI